MKRKAGLIQNSNKNNSSNSTTISSSLTASSSSSTPLGLLSEYQLAKLKEESKKARRIAKARKLFVSSLEESEKEREAKDKVVKALF